MSTPPGVSSGTISSVSVITQAYLNVTQSITQGFYNEQSVKVDCNKSVDIPQTYDIGAVPTFLLFTDGKKAAVKYGSNKEELLAAIKENFSQ